ncbi:MAG: polyribonucleotide nucleotidyltransferase [Candidatus Levybacteria bacterium]|nr:polyribonucleotide nucleotidyltransferase [Candidatus Levybacteria bacterium]
MSKKSVTLEVSGKTLTLETGELASKATSSVLARLGDTMVLVTIVEGSVREDLGYFPLTVEYVERLYAGGRIKGSRWVKREGRPSDEAILNGRLIDRSIRPLFPKEYKKEVQIIITVLSVDGENEPDVLSIVAVSAALSISKIPWRGPISATRVGFVKEAGNGNHEFVINPGPPELEFSELDMIVSQTKEKTIMLEAGAKQIADDIVINAIEKAHETNKKIIDFILEFTKDSGSKKEVVSPDGLLSKAAAIIEKSYKEELLSLIEISASKEARSSELEDLVGKIFDQEKTADPDLDLDKKTIAKALESVFYKIIKDNVINKSKRPDGRKVDEIRQISAQASVLPRTHGSAIFQRGDTQSLTVATLGSPKLEQLIESAEGEETKRYIHHYSMPPYSVGETGRMGVPSRREIGHGALAERAIIPVIPSQDKFPYTIRVVSEILSSNGSTSMAATCGSTLALMDAGVPIENPVAGIAMGMMSRPAGLSGSGQVEKYVILTDILGLEDFSGDMDFKVAGTKNGITAIQLDVKIHGITIEQIKETLEKAKTGRIYILEKMLAVLPSSRTEVSQFAPKIEVVHVPVEKIGEVIGPGGRVIRNIIAETGATVDVEDDGSVTVSAVSEEAVTKAVDRIKGLTREVVAGEVFDGTVKRILPFGAFIEFLPGKEGMVHVSQMSSEFVKNPADVVKIGQSVKVRVIEVDEQGRINLSMLFGETGEGAPPRRAPTEGGPRFTPQQPSTHPLAMQFRRERSAAQATSTRGGPPWRKASRGKPSGSPSRFRKTHY